MVRHTGLFVPLANGADMSSPVLAILNPVEHFRLDLTGHPNGSAALHDELQVLQRELKLRYGVHSILGSSPAMMRARAQVKLAAESAASVLIIGPRGTGKEHLAKAIHFAHCESSGGTLLPLSCAVLSPELLRSTLKAMAARRELLADRQVDTLLFQDVEQMPAEVQAQVADLLTRSSPPIAVISTSGVALDEPRWSSMRADLLAQLSTITIELPPLAERPGDIALIAQSFLEDINRRDAKQVARFSPDALGVLAAHTWPGNLDELAAIVRESHVQATATTIETSDLPDWFHQSVRGQSGMRKPDERINLEKFLAEIERELIDRALRRARGNKSKAAKLLGLNRPRLYRRMKELGFEVECRTVKQKRPNARVSRRRVAEQD
jgi:DNA-binding NtrC family response regulator